MSKIIITSCSNRKTKSDGVKVSPSQLRTGCYADLAKNWLTLVKTSKEKMIARKLYCGRGIQEIKLTAEALKADLWFVSAGLGLIQHDDLIPSYDLTVSPGRGSSFIGDKINAKPFNSKDWWQALSQFNGSNSLRSIVRSDENSLILLSMPGAYFNMISRELDDLTPKELAKLRIVGPSVRLIGDKYLEYLMPYDERLNDPNSELRGTRSDFPPRAARHFAQHILVNKPDQSAEQHSEMVEMQLRYLRAPKPLNRRRLSDADITGLIKKNLIKAKGTSSASLRILRDCEAVACEQKRFSNLFNQLAIICISPNDKILMWSNAATVYTRIKASVVGGSLGDLAEPWQTHLRKLLSTKVPSEASPDIKVEGEIFLMNMLPPEGDGSTSNRTLLITRKGLIR